MRQHAYVHTVRTRYMQCECVYIVRFFYDQWDVWWRNRRDRVDGSGVSSRAKSPPPGRLRWHKIYEYIAQTHAELPAVAVIKYPTKRRRNANVIVRAMISRVLSTCMYSLRRIAYCRVGDFNDSNSLHWRLCIGLPAVHASRLPILSTE